MPYVTCNVALFISYNSSHNTYIGMPNVQTNLSSSSGRKACATGQTLRRRSRCIRFRACLAQAGFHELATNATRLGRYCPRLQSVAPLCFSAWPDRLQAFAGKSCRWERRYIVLVFSEPVALRVGQRSTPSSLCFLHEISPSKILRRPDSPSLACPSRREARCKGTRGSRRNSCGLDEEALSLLHDRILEVLVQD